MTAIFSRILDMSLTGSIVIAAVLLARYFLRKAPKVLSYALWAVVLFRLLCPVSLTAPVSLLRFSRPKVTVTTGGASSISYLQERQTPVVLATEPVTAAQPEARPAENPVTSAAAVPAVQVQPEQKLDMKKVAAWTWLTGAAIMLLSSLVSYLQIYRRLIGATPFRGKVYLADHIPTPFVLGILNPRIYLPSDTPARERQYILAHEEHHIRRFDHIIKVLAYFALCLHWFNPLVWAAFFLAGKDMEMSCDEAVIRKLGPESKADYAQCLLRLATNRPIIAGTPLAFGEGDTKDRVKNMAKWKKPKTWVMAVSIVVCILVVFLCAVNPGERFGQEGQKGPIQVEIDHVHLEIPGKFRLEAGGKESFFFKGEQETGGYRIYELEDALMASEEFQSGWIWLLGVPEVEDGLHEYRFEGSPYSDGMLTVTSDTGRVTEHEFYVTPNRTVEIWFDMDVVLQQERYDIMASVRYEPEKRGNQQIGYHLPENMTSLEIGEKEHRFFATKPLLDSDIGNEEVIPEILGGVRIYDAPERVLTIPSADQWLYQLDVPEMGRYEMTSGISDCADLEVSFTKAPGEMTQHYYFVRGEKVYELWFDTEKVDAMTRTAIVQSVTFGTEASVDQDLPAAQIAQEGAVSMGLSLPGDVVAQEMAAGEIQFFLTVPEPGMISSQADPEELLGGIRTYDTPEKSLEILGMDEWLKALGVPQILDQEYDRMMTGGSGEIAMEAEFIDAGGRETKHYYFIQGETVFELWFDTEKLDAMTRAAIQQSVVFAPDAQIQRNLPMLDPEAVMGDMAQRAEKSTEEVYLERCRSFLEELKACQDYVVQVDRTNYGGAVNDTSEETYAIRGEDWMRMVRIPQDGYLDGVPVWESMIAEMYLDGQYYDNMENPSLTENREVHWGKTDYAYEKMLWFSRFDWDAQDVRYVSSTPAGTGMCITLQVMAPYYENDETCYNHYFVNFIFNNSLEFQRAEITAYFHDEEEGDSSIQEILRVTARDEGMAKNILDYEYQRMLKE